MEKRVSGIETTNFDVTTRYKMRYRASQSMFLNRTLAFDPHSLRV